MLLLALIFGTVLAALLHVAVSRTEQAGRGVSEAVVVGELRPEEPLVMHVAADVDSTPWWSGALGAE